MGGHRNGYISEYGIDDDLPWMSKANLRQHWPEMLAEMGWSAAPHIQANWRDLRRFTQDAKLEPGEVLDLVHDEYRDHFAGLSPEERLDAIAAVYEWQGVTTSIGRIHGHCQGDFGRVLAVATQEWVDRVGAPTYTHKRQLDNAIKLFEDYAFGDVFGYSITNPESEDVDSCWGYFGMDHEQSNLLPHAKSDIDHDIPKRRKRLKMETRARDEACQIAAVFNAQSDGPNLDVRRHTPVEFTEDEAVVNVQLVIPQTSPETTRT